MAGMQESYIGFPKAAEAGDDPDSVTESQLSPALRAKINASGGASLVEEPPGSGLFAFNDES